MPDIPRPAWHTDTDAVRPLMSLGIAPEEVRGACMPSWTHHDGRVCSHHARLDLWVVGERWYCPREHPPVVDLMRRTA